MNSEERKLLVKDLSGRVQSHVRLQVKGCKTECLHDLDGVHGEAVNVTHYELTEDNKKRLLYIDNWVVVDDVKPYLRPLESMTGEEYEEYSHLWELQQEYCTDADIQFKIDLFDWLNEHHFDYRNLIEKGLVLPAPEGMYK